MTEDNSGRITTKQYYEALQEQTKELGTITKEMGQMELRIVKEIHAGITSQREYQTKVDARLAAGSVHFDKFEKDIDNLKLWDKGLGILALIGTAIATAIGIRGE